MTNAEYEQLWRNRLLAGFVIMVVVLAVVGVIAGSLQ